MQRNNCLRKVDRHHCQELEEPIQFWNDDYNPLNLQHRKPEFKAIYITADSVVIEKGTSDRDVSI